MNYIISSLNNLHHRAFTHENPINPIPMYCPSILHHQFSLAMLFPIQPFTHKHFAVVPMKVPFSLLFAVVIFSLVSVAIWPREYPISMHLSILPSASVRSVILPFKYSFPIKKLVFKFSLVDGSRGTHILPKTLFSPVSKFPFVVRS